MVRDLRRDEDDGEDIPTDVHVLKVHVKQSIADHKKTSERVDKIDGHIVRVEGELNVLSTKVSATYAAVKIAVLLMGLGVAVLVAVGGLMAWALSHVVLK